MDEIYDSFPATVVSEMASGADTLVPLSRDLVEEITSDDDDPKFATFVIESGWSKSKRYWGPEVLDSISEQINKGDDPIVGYMGHIRPEDDAYSFPDIQLRWLKSRVQVSSDKVKLFAKAYVLPGTKGREYLKRGLARSVSIKGLADQIPMKGGLKMANFDLESIDLARPRKAGMSARLVGALTSEMSEGRQAVESKDIAALSEAELREHNPLLVKEIEENAKKPLTEKVSEMETKEEDAKANTNTLVEIRKALNIDENADVLEILGATLSKLKEQGKELREKLLKDVLEKRFKDEGTRVLATRLIASEMSDKEIPDDPDSAKVKVTEMVNELIDGDADLKKLAVVEQTGSDQPNLGGKENDRSNGTKEMKPGHEDEFVSVRKVGA